MVTKVADVLVEFNAEDSGLKKAAKDATTSLNDVGNSGGGIGDKIKGGMAVASKAMVAFAASAAIAIGGIAAESVKLYSELQQNMGGVEAVFGDGYDVIEEKAYSAYKNMGLSASNYMSTANKMGSLFQGSGIEQSKAMQMTTDAMQRAADVAAVMGVDMQMAMESVAGAAKGNFTMMDNLGVAMNATAIEAYALEKGINFNWNTASQAQKAEVAMQMFMDRTSAYADKFAEESEQTISGSIGMMKSSWENLMAGFANPDQSGLDGLVTSFVESFSTVASNILPVVQQVLSSVGTALPGLVTQLLPILTEVLTQIITMITTVLPTLIPLLVQAAVSLFTALVNALPLIIPALITGLTTLVTSLVAVLPTLIPALLEAAVQLMTALPQALTEIIPALVEALPLVIDAVVTLLPTLLPQLLQAAIDLFMALVEALPQIIDALIQAIPLVIDAVIKLLPTLIPMLLSASLRLFMALVQAVPQILGSLLSAIGSLISSGISALGGAVGQFLQAGKNIIMGLINGIISMGARIGQTLLNIVKNAVSSMLGFLGIHSPSKLFTWMGEMSGEGLAGGILSMAKTVVSAAKGLADKAVTAAQDGMSQIGSIAASAMSSVQRDFNLGSVNGVLDVSGRLQSIGSAQVAEMTSRNNNAPFIGQIIVPDGADPMAFAQHIGAQVRFA